MSTATTRASQWQCTQYVHLFYSLPKELPFYCPSNQFIIRFCILSCHIWPLCCSCCCTIRAVGGWPTICLMERKRSKSQTLQMRTIATQRGKKMPPKSSHRHHNVRKKSCIRNWLYFRAGKQRQCDTTAPSLGWWYTRDIDSRIWQYLGIQ